MRAFLAIELNNHVIDNIKQTQKTLKNTDYAKIKYVEEKNMHITLKFFGDINPRKQKQITKIINNTITNYEPYTIKIANIGAFPNIKRPRVIWTGIKDKNNYTINLIKQLDEEFSKIGFEKERNYKPHITLGRVKEVYDRELSKVLSDLKNNYHGKVEINKIVLKSSQLTPDGPIYKTEEEFIL